VLERIVIHNLLLLLSPIDFDDIEKHSASGVLCLRDDIRVKMEEKLAEAMECRQIAKDLLKRLNYK
jgi:hypothetical protein